MTTMQNKNSTLAKDRVSNSQDMKDESGKKTYAGDLEFLNKL